VTALISNISLGNTVGSSNLPPSAYAILGSSNGYGGIMSHKLTRYELTYVVFVDAHDEDEALDEAASTGDLDPYLPDAVKNVGEGDECYDDVCDEEGAEDDDV
jgi:hypothetical protein